MRGLICNAAALLLGSFSLLRNSKQICPVQSATGRFYRCNRNQQRSLLFTESLYRWHFNHLFVHGKILFNPAKYFLESLLLNDNSQCDCLSASSGSTPSLPLAPGPLNPAWKSRWRKCLHNCFTPIYKKWKNTFFIGLK